jgi:hypothetical protein
MWILKGERGSGKSWELVRDSAKMQIPILVSHERNVEYVKERAKEQNLNIPDPIVYQKGMHLGKSVLVDDLESFISSVLGGKIVGATSSTIEIVSKDNLFKVDEKDKNTSIENYKSFENHYKTHTIKELKKALSGGGLEKPVSMLYRMLNIIEKQDKQIAILNDINDSLI